MKNDMWIQKATPEDAGLLAAIIAEAYHTVALEFGLTPDNCPKHPSNCTPDWITADLNRGVSYYLCFNQGKPIGCAALEQADEKTTYLERLAVRPGFRHQGTGAGLVKFIVEKARICKAETLGVGIIDEQSVLKEWYKDLGFKITGTRKFDHLPFTVGFMELALR